MAFSLPIIENTKNIAWFLLLIFFSIRVCKQKINLLSNSLGNYILLFLVGSIVAAIGATLNGYDADKIRDIIRYSLVGWIIIYIPLSQKQILTILGLLIISTIIGTIDANISLLTGKEKHLELRSVGHINHTAIYILLTIGAAIPLLLFSKLPKILRFTLLVVSLYLIFIQIQTNSRATLLALILIVAISIAYLLFFNKKLGIISLVISTFIVGYIAINPPPIIHKIKTAPTVFTGDQLTPREKLWNTAFYAWKKEPFFGIGYGNYRIISASQLRQWYPNEEIDFNNKAEFHYLSHSHNRFINTLVEGGIVGFAGLIIFLFGILAILLKYRRRLAINSNDTAFWFVGFNTLLTITIIGFVNTTIHHEHGILTMMLLGLVFNHINNKENRYET